MPFFPPSSTGGLDLAYAYDGLNRLSMFTDSGAAQPPLEHSYSYDANGSLESLSYSNGVTHNWSYDSQNRLKNLSIRNSSLVILNSYSYTLGAFGHRRSITEANGRTVGYTLDNQYRLTQETITGDPAVVSGTSDWSYDLVGNRLSQNSDIDTILNQVETYSANNWLDSDTYDANGNTLGSQVSAPALYVQYDWRNRLVRREKADGTLIEIVYDGFGDRLKKTVTPFGDLGESTWFLVDRNNLTGYAQVVEEIGQGNELQVIYSYGLDLISQDRRDDDGSGNFTQSFYLYDGLGTVRALADDVVVVTDTYTYDAWGVEVASTGTTENAFRFIGEQWDADLEMYFLRARYLNVATGRFHTMDTFEGVTTDPVTLHKYLYANAAPHMFTDPSGNFSLTEINIVNFVRGILLPGITPLRVGISGIAGVFDILTVTNVYRPAALGFTYFASDPNGILFQDEMIGAEYFANLATTKTFEVLAGTSVRLYTIHLGLVLNTALSTGINALGGDWRKSVPVLGTYVEVTEAVNFYNTTMGWLSSVSASGRSLATGQLDLSEATIGDLLSVSRRIDATIIGAYDALSAERK
jgi:RHS repeat-associated protein